MTSVLVFPLAWFATISVSIYSTFSQEVFIILLWEGEGSTVRIFNFFQCCHCDFFYLPSLELVAVISQIIIKSSK